MDLHNPINHHTFSITTFVAVSTLQNFFKHGNFNAIWTSNLIVDVECERFKFPYFPMPNEKTFLLVSNFLEIEYQCTI